ncbi:hypothetical protein D3C87_579180 [compost metagenome]
MSSTAIVWPSGTPAMPWSDTTITLVVWSSPRACSPSSRRPTAASTATTAAVYSGDSGPLSWPAWSTCSMYRVTRRGACASLREIQPSTWSTRSSSGTVPS